MLSRRCRFSRGARAVDRPKEERGFVFSAATASSKGSAAARKADEIWFRKCGHGEMLFEEYYRGQGIVPPDEAPTLDPTRNQHNTSKVKQLAASFGVGTPLSPPTHGGLGSTSPGSTDPVAHRGTSPVRNTGLSAAGPTEAQRQADVRAARSSKYTVADAQRLGSVLDAEYAAQGRTVPSTLGVLTVARSMITSGVKPCGCTYANTFTD